MPGGMSFQRPWDFDQGNKPLFLNDLLNPDAEVLAALEALGATGNVASVNGQTGAVVLDAADVGAAETAHAHVVGDTTGLQTALDGKSDDGHTHDDRYYTEGEVDTLLSGVGGGLELIPAANRGDRWWGANASASNATLAVDTIYLAPFAPGYLVTVKRVGFRTTTAPSSPIDIQVAIYDMVTLAQIQDCGTTSVSGAGVIELALGSAVDLTGPVYFALKIRAAAINGAVFKAGVPNGHNVINTVFGSSSLPTVADAGTGAMPASLPTTGWAEAGGAPFIGFKSE